MDLKLCFIDLETTGTDHLINGIVQIGGIMCVEHENGEIEEWERFNYFLRPFPGDVVDPGALAVNKHTELEISGFPAPFDVHHDFLTMLERHIEKYNRRDKALFVGYNATFDDQFLRAWFKKLHDDYYGSWFSWPPVDMAQWALRKLRHRRHELKDFRLGTIAQELGIKPGGELHDAFSDILITKEIYQLTK